MERLVFILNYLSRRRISIDSINYDGSSDTTLIMMVFETGEKMIEISDKKFCFFNDKINEFNNYSTEEIKTYLDEFL